jgi:uncharacterized protein YdhG (YjbR/CyaY superfamily)
MTSGSGDRSQHFPSIEKKHGGRITDWIERVRDLGDAKYAEQVAHLKENFGFSQTHANAVVMFVRGSTSSRRFASPDAYFAAIDAEAAQTARAIFDVILKTHPKLELVIAWNQPVLRSPRGYVIGLSTATNHLTINPFSKNVIDSFADELRGLGVSKHTFKVPIGWKVNSPLLRRIVKARLAEMD